MANIKRLMLAMVIVKYTSPILSVFKHPYIHCSVHLRILIRSKPLDRTYAGMLDPRYAPPEQLVLPKDVPRVRSIFLCALISPIAWQIFRPDLFDSYSAGKAAALGSTVELLTSNAWISGCCEAKCLTEWCNVG